MNFGIWSAFSEGPFPGSGPDLLYKVSPYIFTKHLKVPVAFLLQLGSLIINNLDDMLVIGKSLEETLVYRHILIILMQQLSFVINQEESLMILTQIIEFSGIKVDSKAMTISLPEEKIQKIKSKCLKL